MRCAWPIVAANRKPSSRRLRTAASIGHHNNVDMWPVNILLISSDIFFCERRPAPTCGQQAHAILSQPIRLVIAPWLSTAISRWWCGLGISRQSKKTSDIFAAKCRPCGQSLRRVQPYTAHHARLHKLQHETNNGKDFGSHIKDSLTVRNKCF